MLLAQVLFALLALLALTVPVGIAIGMLSFAGLYARGLPMVASAQTVFENLDSFSLMAVPFYILAGSIMQAGGISQRLVNLANAMIGWLTYHTARKSNAPCMISTTRPSSSKTRSASSSPTSSCPRLPTLISKTSSPGRSIGVSANSVCFR
ncbi:TRAP transporter large permease subunit [Aminobacter sp. MDW-2]|nr:TRAP transporter large permease subunit [Aminobacter sp. MDW-2]